MKALPPGIVSVEWNVDKNVDGKFGKYNAFISDIHAKESYTRNNLHNRSFAAEYEKATYRK